MERSRDEDSGTRSRGLLVGSLRKLKGNQALWGSEPSCKDRCEVFIQGRRSAVLLCCGTRKPSAKKDRAGLYPQSDDKESLNSETRAPSNIRNRNQLPIRKCLAKHHAKEVLKTAERVVYNRKAEWNRKELISKRDNRHNSKARTTAKHAELGSSKHGLDPSPILTTQPTAIAQGQHEQTPQKGQHSPQVHGVTQLGRPRAHCL